MISLSDTPVKYTGAIPKNTYHRYCSNVYSQNGEDGILQQLLQELGIREGYCCEFGASDGITGSNTLELVKTKGFTGLFLEADKERVDVCRKNLSPYPKAIVRHERVTSTNLTQFLEEAQFPQDFDVLSIDIDSYDYDVWKGFVSHKPKIVLIEANSYRDPIMEEYHQQPSPDYSRFDPLLATKPDRIAAGTSFLPLVKLGLDKGYIPVAFTGNIIFVVKDFIYKLKEFPYKISGNPYDYIDLYTNLILWGQGNQGWFTNDGLQFNTAIRNSYLCHKTKEVDLQWVINELKSKGQEIWKFAESDSPFVYTIPSTIRRIKIDVGLSYGAPQTQVWLNQEKDLFVFGFEPNPDSVRSLQSPNIQKQQPGHGQPLSDENKSRFHLFPIALSDVTKKEEMDFYMTANDCGTSSLFKPKESIGPIKAKVKVPVYSLAHFFETFPWDRFPYIEYLKIDAQGADLKIVRGAKQYLSEKVVFVTLEPHGSDYEGGDDCTEENIENYMLSNNFLQIQHPNTGDPTFVNRKFLDIAKSIFIYQKG